MSNKVEFNCEELNLEDLSKIQIESILLNNVEEKRTVLLGKLNDRNLIAILDKKAFDEESLKTQVFLSENKLEKIFQNDIYGSYNCLPIPKLSEIKTTIVFPATEKHIQKYTQYPIYLVEETEEIYKNVLLPYIQESVFSVEWVYNILDHKKEVDRIIFEDTNKENGFILAPDLKWDGKSLDNLYLTAIVHSREIKSLRCLKQKHLTLLENILTKGKKAICEKYDVKQSQLRVYIHYLPSYFHLHVHFNLIHNQVGGIHAGKAHLLTTVIDNIKRQDNYYQVATITYLIKENDKLYQRLLEYGYKF